MKILLLLLSPLWKNNWTAQLEVGTYEAMINEAYSKVRTLRHIGGIIALIYGTIVWDYT